MTEQNALRHRVTRFLDSLQKQDVNLHGFLLSVNGQEKAKGYCPPFQEGQPHRMYSVSKTMTGLAIGMLAEEGKLRLDQSICDFFRDWLPPQPDGRLLRLTIRDMLRMATCYRQTTYREGIDENWAQTFFTSTPTHEPGAVFYYDTGCSQVLAALVKRLSGQEVIDFLNDRLFFPLGCQDEHFWLRDPSGCCQGGTGLCMSLRDLHKVAQCLMNGGEGLAPTWYVEAMGQKHIDTPLQDNEEEQYGYGWQCWRTRAGWAMYGLGGQLAILYPDKRAILCTIADTRLDPFGVQRIYNAFFQELYPYLDREDMAPTRFEIAHQLVPHHPEYAMGSTPRFTFSDGNPLQLKWLQLRDSCLYYENARGPVELPFACGQNVPIPFPGWPDVPAQVAAGWLAPGQLRLRCHAIGNAPCGFDLLLSLRENRATVQCKRSHDPVTEGYDGVVSGECDP